MAMYDNSRYLHSTMIRRIGWDKPTLDIRERYTFNEKNCTIYQWIQADTLDGVAFKMYGNANLRWAILDANPDYNTEFDIQNGDYILIPNFEEVKDIINV